MSKKNRKSVLGLALGTLVLGVLVGLLTVGTVAADPTPGVHIQIPRIDVGDVLGTGEWETWIQAQNVGDDDTGAIFLGWGDYSGLCPTNDPGVIVHYCQYIRQNSIWTLRTQIADEVRSGIIYTVDKDVFIDACYAAEETEGDTAAWRCWLEEWEFGTCDDEPGGGWNDAEGDAFGEDVAVTVTRYGPNDYGTFISSTYTGISEEMEGEDSPYEYYAPYVMKGYNGLDTELTIQNSGTLCTSVWINYLEQGSCNVLYKQHIEQLAPGEAIRVRVPCDTGQIPCFWLGSAHIAAEAPLGIVVDETSFDEPCVGVDRGTLLTHRARPLKEKRGEEWIMDTKVYADLIFREWSGWDASIQVQNLSRTGQHTFVTVDFMDNSGDEILFLADWVCPTGSTTFYLPIVTNLGYEYVGAAEIQSHDQIDYPGGETPAQPIFAVVDLKKPDDPLTPEMDAQGGSYNAHPESQKEWVTEVALPFMTKDAQDQYTPWTSMIAIRNNSNCNKIKPRIDFRDETGTLMCQLDSPWLQPKHLKMIDLNNIGCLHAGYIGSATVVVTQVEQLCDVDEDGVVDQEPTMPSVIVVEKGVLGLPYGGGVSALADTWGDVTNIYEGTPYKFEFWPCTITISGQVIDEVTSDPIDGADVSYDGVGDTTDSTGYFEFDVTSNMGGTDFTLVVEAEGYATWTSDMMTLYCDDVVINPELDPTCEDVSLTVYIEDKETGDPIVLDDLTDLTATTSAGSGVVASTAVAGEYEVTDIEWDPDSPVIVSVAVEGYNVSIDTVYIPVCGGSGTLTFQLHQTPMSRILLYYGNDGNAPEAEALPNDSQHEYYNAEDMFEYLGYLVDYTDVWPGDPDLEEYKVIFLLGPGNDVADEDAAQQFTPGQLSQLDLFLRNGGRLVVMGESGKQVEVENQVLGELNDDDVKFVEADAAHNPSTVNGALADDLNGPDQLLGDTVPTTPITDVATLDFDTAISITVDVANAVPGYIARVDAPHPQAGATVCAADTPAGVTRFNQAFTPFAGDVVVIGDKDWMDDASFMGEVTHNPQDPTKADYVWPDWPADNENLLLNIIGF